MLPTLFYAQADFGVRLAIAEEVPYSRCFADGG